MSSATMIEMNKSCQKWNTPSTNNLPRCTFKVERCPEGVKINCNCEDAQAVGTLQEMCKALTGGKLGFSCTANGLVVCQCNLCTCECNCTATQNGVCFTCTSGDKNCGAMIEACCNCLCACVKAGCDCCICLDGTRLCCCTSC